MRADLVRDITEYLVRLQSSVSDIRTFTSARTMRWLKAHRGSHRVWVGNALWCGCRKNFRPFVCKWV